MVWLGRPWRQTHVHLRKHADRHASNTSTDSQIINNYIASHASHVVIKLIPKK